MHTLKTLIESVGTAEFARIINCSESSARHYRDGRRKPSGATIRQIRDKFGLPVEVIRPDLFS